MIDIIVLFWAVFLIVLGVHIFWQTGGPISLSFTGIFRIIGIFIGISSVLIVATIMLMEFDIIPQSEVYVDEDCRSIKKWSE